MPSSPAPESPEPTTEARDALERVRKLSAAERAWVYAQLESELELPVQNLPAEWREALQQRIEQLERSDGTLHALEDVEAEAARLLGG